MTSAQQRLSRAPTDAQSLPTDRLIIAVYSRVAERCSQGCTVRRQGKARLHLFRENVHHHLAAVDAPSALHPIHRCVCAFTIHSWRWCVPCRHRTPVASLCDGDSSSDGKRSSIQSSQSRPSTRSGRGPTCCTQRQLGPHLQRKPSDPAQCSAPYTLTVAYYAPHHQPLAQQSYLDRTYRHGWSAP